MKTNLSILGGQTSKQILGVQHTQTLINNLKNLNFEMDLIFDIVANNSVGHLFRANSFGVYEDSKHK